MDYLLRIENLIYSTYAEFENKYVLEDDFLKEEDLRSELSHLEKKIEDSPNKMARLNDHIRLMMGYLLIADEEKAEEAYVRTRNDDYELEARLVWGSFFRDIETAENDELFMGYNAFGEAWCSFDKIRETNSLEGNFYMARLFHNSDRKETAKEYYNKSLKEARLKKYDVAEQEIVMMMDILDQQE